MKALTTAEVAELLSVCDRTVTKLKNSGELPGFRVGNRLRFLLTDVDKWIERQRVADADKK
jgi:excisionase family DNA binding protein